MKMDKTRFLAAVLAAGFIVFGTFAVSRAADANKQEGPKMMWCHACGFNLDIPGFRGKSDIYCSHCTDKGGKLKVTRDEVQKAMANWFKSWQPNLDDATAMKRADHYLKAMPQWAED